MIDLTVKTLDSQNHVFSLEDDQITVRGFKEYIAESVAVPADSQRLIYCGRVLQDEKKLNDYDVNGKVIHLVQRAPPQPGQHGNDGGQTQGQTQNRQGWQNSQRPHYRVTRTQMHGNAMYLGAMSVPAEIVEGHGIPQLSNSLSGSRLNHAGRMLDQINELIDRLDDPSAPPLHPPSEVNQSAAQHQQQNQQQQQQQNQQESEIEQNEDDSARLAEAAAAAITAALSAAGARAVTLFRGSSYNSGSTRASSDANEHQNDVQSSQSQSHSQSQSQPQQQSQTQSQQQQQQQQQQQTQGTADTGATSSNAGQNRRAQQQDLPRPPQMAELLQRLCNTQDRLRPYLERYCMLTLLDPSFESGPNIVEESQRIIDGVSEILHLMSHCCHALSDIIIDMSQPPPRNLRCRPIIIQHSAILQPSIPIQVEAHISLNGRSANNNNTNEETAESGNQAQSDNTESSTSSRINTEDGNEERESDNAMQSQERPQDQGSSPFDSVFNLPNNVEVLMEVSSESNIDAGSNNEQNASGNENNNNARRTNVFPFGTPPPPHFMRNFMQAVAGHMVHGGITTTTISTRNPPVITVGTQQGTSSSMDNGSTNAGQSTQARSNTGTHPTTATQTRSTSRPHVFHHHAHPMGLGMSIGLGLDFDPYLPCNSHHVYRSPNSTFNTGTGMTTSSQATRTTSTTTADAQNQTNQAATTLTTTTSTTSTSTTSATNAETTTNNSFANFLQQLLNQSAGGQLQSNINITPNLMENIGNIMQVLGNNIHVGFLSDNSMGNAPTLADLLEVGGLSMAVFPSHESGEGNFLVDLLVLLAQSMSLDGLIRVRLGWEAIARVRRPLQEFLQYTFSSASSPEAIQEQAIERLLSQLRPHIQNLLASEEDTSAARSGSRGSRVDICATIESLITRHARDILRILFDSGINDAKFGQDILNILINMCSQICIVLRYSLRGGLEAIVTRFMRNLMDGGNPVFLRWIMNGLIAHLRTYFLSTQFPESIMQLLIYRDAASQPSSVSSTSTRQPTQAQSEDVPMETETLEQQPQEQQQQSMRESSISEDREEIPETFPGHEALPSDWVPIIARDGVRQRRQLQMQGVAPNGGMAFSDAYLGSLPSKRRKLIEQQKPRLLVSPTPNHSAIAASIERLVREGIDRAGVEMDEGVVGDPAADVAADPAVRRAFGQAIRDCLNPCRYSTPDFPDPLRFPNATKYFANQERPPK